MSLSKSSSIPPPPPLSLPVYSLSVPYIPSKAEAFNTLSRAKTSMNIVTYATAASVAPPKLWTVSLYTNTLTHHAFFYCSDKIPFSSECGNQQTRWGILQLLSKHQSALVEILGKHSGIDEKNQGYDKEIECMKVGYPWVHTCLKQSQAFLTYQNRLLPQNDYHLYDQQQQEQQVDVYSSRKEISNSVQVLAHCQAYLLITYTGQYMNAGDHDVALCQVIDSGIWPIDDSEIDGTRNGDMSSTITGAGNIQWASSSVGKESTIKSWNDPKDETVVLYTGYLRSIGLL